MRHSLGTGICSSNDTDIEIGIQLPGVGVCRGRARARAKTWLRLWLRTWLRTWWRIWWLQLGSLEGVWVLFWGVWGLFWALLGGSGGHLGASGVYLGGPSWGHLGPKRAQDPKKGVKGKRCNPPLEGGVLGAMMALWLANMRPKIYQTNE